MEAEKEVLIDEVGEVAEAENDVAFEDGAETVEAETKPQQSKEDNAKFAEERRRREAESKAKTEAKPKDEGKQENAEQDPIAKDLTEFAEKYGQDRSKFLLQDTDFWDYAEGKIGKKSLVELYEGYTRLIGKSASESKPTINQSARKTASVGSVSGNNQTNSEYYTLAEIKAMDVSTIEKNYDKVIKSLKANSK